MIALIDTPEFAAAKDALQKAVRAFEDARLDVLIQLRAFAEEVRRLEAPTADDIEAMAKPLPKTQPPSEAQTPKPHACPRCDEGMRGVEVANRHRWTRDEAREAGKKGAEPFRGRGDYMAELGRKGGAETQRRRREQGR